MTTNMEHQSSPTPHVLMFPLPNLGHITPMLNLAELFCLANFKVTFLNTIHTHQRLTDNSDIETRFSRYPSFAFKTIPDGLPDNHPRAGEPQLWVTELIQALESSVKPLIREILAGETGTNKVTCFILDAWLSFAIDIANEVHVPVIAFMSLSACFVWSHFCIPKLIEVGEMPFQDEEMDQLVKNVPGMDSFLRYRDLPSYCRIQDVSTCRPMQGRFLGEIQQLKQAHSFLINTFDDLEGPILSLIRWHYCSKTYSIGPLHTHLKYRLCVKEAALSTNFSNNLWKVDQNCISWLDKKPDKSVIYVSFGSITILTKDQLMEFWAGLVQSMKYFLWVMRPDLILTSVSDNTIQDDIMNGTKERGCLVDWAPQEEVLGHRAVGGFLTHGGWNSLIESITTGVPNLCWAYYADQHVNSRLVSEIWRIGVDMKDTCDRTIVKNMIIDLMERKKSELERSISRISNLAKESVSESGSSHLNLNYVIEEIKAMMF